MYIYYPSDAKVYVRQVGGPNKVTEQWISTGPDQVMILQDGTPPTASMYFITASYAINFAYSYSLATSASYAGTASYSLHSIGTPTASYAGTASVLNIPVPSYGLTGFNPISGISQGQLILWVNPSTGSFMDAFLQYPVNMHGQIVRSIGDQSGLGHNLQMQSGNQPHKYSIVYNVGPNKNKTGIWIETMTGNTITFPTITAPSYPLYLFVVAQTPISITSAAVFDGVGSATRMLCSVGQSPQLNAGIAYQPSITGSLLSQVQNKWFLQTFKNTAGGTNSYIRTNMTQSTAGSVGGQTITGFSFGSDYSGAGGATTILELLLYSNITDADALNIEQYLMSKHEIWSQN